MASRPSQQPDPKPEHSNGRARVPGRAVAIALVTLLLSGLVAAAYHAYASVQRELTASAMARSAALSQLAAATLEERLERMVDLAASLATRVRFAELVAQGDWGTAAGILRAVPAEFPYVERLFLADAAGTLQVDVPALPGVRGSSFAGRDWFLGVSRDWRTYVSPVYRREAQPQHNVIAVATPVRRRAGEPVAGILVLQLSPARFFDWSKAIDLGAGAELIVVDPKGQAAYRSGVPAQLPAADLSGDPGVGWLRQGRAGAEVARDAAQEEWLYAFKPVRQGWGVLIRQPAGAAFAGRDMQLRLLQVAYALFGLLAAALAWMGLRFAARRREQLALARRSLERHAERLRILGEIDRAVVAEQPFEAIAAAVIQPLRQLLEVPRAIVNRIDLAAGEVEWIAAAGRRRVHVGPGVRYALPLMGDAAALARGETQLVDVRTLPASAETQALLASGVRYYQVVPMIAGGELLGAISFGGGTSAFPPEQVAIAQEVATQLAIAQLQARLLERVRRQAEELESRVRARTAELEAANKELDAFSYSVSHDLRAPLRAVDGFARMLEDDHARHLDAEGRRLLGVVRGEARRMGRLIDDLLAFSRAGRQAMQASQVDVVALVRDVVAELAHGFPSAEVRIGTLPPAAADRALLRQVWVNLVGNALKYSGKVPAPRVEIGGRDAGAEAEYWVQDNGAGFDPRYAHNLFAVFQRLHGVDEFAGTGVGLAIVQRVVARHGGRVWAQGSPGAGARFSFSLPLAGRQA